MFKKSIVSAFLAVILIFSFAGCKNAGTDSSSDMSSVNSEDSAVKAPEFDETKFELVAQPSEEYGAITVYSSFSNGYAVITKGSLYGYIGADGKIAGDGIVYSYAENFSSEGLAAVGFTDNTAAYINKDFEKVITSIDGESFETTDENNKIIPHSFNDGYAVIERYDGSNRYSAVINTDGETVIPFDSKNHYCYSYAGDGLFFRSTSDTTLGTALVDAEGKTVFSLDGSAELCNYYNGTMYYLEDNKDNGMLFGIIDKTGKKLTDAVYAYDPQSIRQSDVIFAGVSDDGIGKFIDVNGKELFTISGISDAAVYKNVIRVKSENGYSTYDLNGKLLFEKMFKDIDYSRFTNGYGVFYDSSSSCGISDETGATVMNGCTDISYCGENMFFAVVNEAVFLFRIK